ncbi:unnamed protein product [Didymodactylos carnosus]|uniref:tRNA (guanine(9)-N(1))-methyltransferase n=1 Tax=Didymodactylos carnosus TaxID=1234261 RepID=A0A814LMT9_9BILA|nr:unnamed protein product [Didymodactylos carnosus]CAF1314326.1 unnamed protein product [Didymodactylos carnosus]CAF3835416.1 unnamed protein product [Didymodactylos carnosus]CAF4122845.1 unnamed protein product [Didymodactylos carnosus]
MQRFFFSGEDENDVFCLKHVLDFQKSMSENEIKQPVDTVDSSANSDSLKHEGDNDVQEKNEKPISKNQLRRLRRRQLILEKRKEKREVEREKLKQRKREKRKREQQQPDEVVLPPNRKKLRSNLMSKSTCKIRLAIDCQFDNLMSERDISSLHKQISYCYAANRRQSQPCQFYLTNVNGQLEEKLRSNSAHNWDLNIETKTLDELFPHDEIVYLTSESDNVMTNEQLNSSYVYVIGGLVDHNSRKGLCYQIANDKKWKHVRLPIDEYLKMNTRKVLTCNHVFEILLNYIEMKNWKQALQKFIPKRKQVLNETTENKQENELDQASVSQTLVLDKNGLIERVDDCAGIHKRRLETDEPQTTNNV